MLSPNSANNCSELCIDPRTIELHPQWTSNYSVQGGDFNIRFENSPYHQTFPDTINADQTMIEYPIRQLSLREQHVPGGDYPSGGVNDQETAAEPSGQYPTPAQPTRSPQPVHRPRGTVLRGQRDRLRPLANTRRRAAGLHATRGSRPRQTIRPRPGGVTNTSTQTNHTSLAQSRVAKKPQDNEKKAKTKKVRERGACLRCSLYREQVSADATPAKDLAAGAEKFSPGAEKFTSVLWYREYRGGSPIWGNKSPAPDTIQWHPSDREKVIRFYHTWPVESRTTTGPKVEVHVKKFIPQEDDLTSRRYRIAGGYAQADRPHYATVEPTEKLSKDLLKWVEKNKGNLLSIYNFGREVEAGRDTRRLMELAIKFGRENKLQGLIGQKGSMVDLALNVFIGSRLAASERSMSDLDGAKPVHDESSFLNRVNMIPPLLDYQLDMAVIRFQTRLVDEIFKRIYKKMRVKTEDAANSWFEVFLTCFILMQNLQFVHQTQKTFPDYILAMHSVSPF
ncbi:MAG: hypothetical protein M1813_008011 [Trichoglossum hirsutum]|nr:MAG: hypothetical protein M1813_008011 [Trichoglossum hirsutum]